MLEGGEGPPLLLIHGLGGSGDDFLDLAPLIMDRYRLIIPDLLGFGRSDKPRAPYAMSWQETALASLVAELGLERAHWLGHSMGGLLVLAMGVDYPGLVDGLVAVSPAGGHVHLALWHKIMMALMPPTFPLPPIHGLLIQGVVIESFADPGRPEAEDLKQRLKAQWDLPDRPARERALLLSGRQLLRRQIWRELTRLERPVLLVAGEADRMVPMDQIERIWAELPAGSRLEILPCGHMAPYVEPKALAAAIEAFLEQGR